MKNKLKFLCNSFKQSIVNKPIAFVFLILIFFAMTISCSIPSRWLAGGLNDEFSSPNAIHFKISPSDFKENIIEIGDYIRANCDDIAFDDRAVESHFKAWHSDVTIDCSGKNIKFDEISVCFVVKEEYGITEDDIASRQKVICVNEKIALENGLNIGDELNIYGNNLTIKAFVPSDDRISFVIPYNIQINEWYAFRPSTHNYGATEIEISGHIYNLKYNGLSRIKNGLKRSGCKDLSSPINIGSLAVVINVVVAVFIICIISSISIIGYWLKCNSKKYATFKTLGSSPALLACAMIIETLIVVMIAIGLGALVDYLIATNMQFEMPLGTFAWLHYLVLIGGTFISSTIMVVIAVVKRAIAMPANTKYNS